MCLPVTGLPVVQAFRAEVVLPQPGRAGPEVFITYNCLHAVFSRCLNQQCMLFSECGEFLGHVAPALAAATGEHCVSPLNFFVFLRSETLLSMLSPKYPTQGTATVGARTAKCPENTL